MRWHSGLNPVWPSARKRSAELIRRSAGTRSSWTPRRLRQAASLLDPPIIVDDEIAGWIAMTVPGWLHPGHLYLIDLAVRNLPSTEPVLEIGSYCGLSTNVIRRFLDLHEKSNDLWTCDPWAFGPEGPIAGSELTFAGVRDFAKEAFVHAARHYSVHRLPFTIHATSDEFFEQWRKAAQRRTYSGASSEAAASSASAISTANTTRSMSARTFATATRTWSSAGTSCSTTRRTGANGRSPTLFAQSCARVAMSSLGAIPPT